MDLQRIRTVLVMGIVIVGILLYGNWQKDHAQPTPTSTAIITTNSAIPTNLETRSDIPQNATVSLATAQEGQGHKTIHVKSDVLDLQLSLDGGDIIYAALPEYNKNFNQDIPEPFVLLDDSSERYYIAQSGLVGNDGPDSVEKGRAIYKSAQSDYQLAPDAETLEVVLTWNKAPIQVNKIYTLTRGSYIVNVRYDISNIGDRAWEGRLYGQIKRKSGDTGGMFSAQGYQGAAYHTEDKPYQKLTFSKIEKKALDRNIEGGWVAMTERYFVTAWVPASDATHSYFSRMDTQHRYHVGAMDMPVQVLPGDSKTVSAQWYIGPEVAAPLKALAPGLDLVVDYGFLWPIAQTLIWVLRMIYQVIGNWGWAIVVLTILLKLAFFKLSASSYNSMEKLRRLQPQINHLKEKHGDNRQRFSEEMLALYRTHKVNPLGGFLPLLIQIPVFIALYYGLLESIELRHAPFMLWIQDLSSHDPYFVLPILMGLTMMIQQRLVPASGDPMQAKVMMFMPVLFTVIGLQFPAGLTLYWVVNNIISILQQSAIGNRHRKT